MSALQTETIIEELKRALRESGFEPPAQIALSKIPFSGRWGWGAPVCFQLASAERKAGKKVQVNLRAQEIASQIRDRLQAGGRFAQIEASKGYVNIFFDTGEVANRLTAEVLERRDDFGRGPSAGERVMVEFSQPNTHKSFHVGHLRNVCLGHSLSNILDCAGFEVVRANYLGDIGLHVIKCLWCYLRFHREEERPPLKGRWLGEIYAKADKLLGRGNAYREEVAGFMAKCLQEEPAGSWVRQSLAERFYRRFETALQENRDDGELARDLVAMVGKLFARKPIEVNEIAHRPVGGWLWQLWMQWPEWLQDLQGQASRKDKKKQAESLQSLLGECRDIGIDAELWGYAKEVRDLFARWERQDPELLSLWEETRRWSLDDFDRIYSQLGVPFDECFYESEVEQEGKGIVEEIIGKGLATDLRPNGAVIVEIDKLLGKKNPDFRTIVILRSDGTSLYSTKDLSLAKRKFEKYKVDRSVYVVDVGQSLYFRQIFKVLQLWGFEQAKKCFHLAYEIVRLPSGKMSSREGSVVFYDDFFQEALRRARSSVDEKRSAEQFSEIPDLDEKQRSEVAQAVALGAMKYGMLAVDNNKQISFDFDSALSFEGQTAPYIQYGHARCCRIFEKAGISDAPAADFSQVELQTAEINLLEAIASFPEQVQRAAREYKPLYITVYLYQLAKAFNDFYRDCPVLKAEGAVRDARLSLVACTRQTLSNGLRLLGIPSPEVM